MHKKIPCLDKCRVAADCADTRSVDSRFSGCSPRVTGLMGNVYMTAHQPHNRTVSLKTFESSKSRLNLVQQMCMPDPDCEPCCSGRWNTMLKAGSYIFRGTAAVFRFGFAQECVLACSYLFFCHTARDANSAPLCLSFCHPPSSLPPVQLASPI